MNPLDALRKDPRLLLLGSVSALRGIRDNLRYVVWQPFAISLGYDMRSLGFFEGVMDVSKILVEPALGALSDAIGRRKLMIIREALVLAAGVILLTVPSWGMLFAAMVLVGFGNALMSVWNAVVAESADPDRLGYAYGLVGTCFMGAGLLGTLGSGYISDAYGYGAVYSLSTVFAVATLSIVWLRLPETRREAPTRVDARETFLALFKALNPPRHLRIYYIVMGLDLFAFSMGLRLMNGMLAKCYGYTGTMIGLYMTAMTLAQTVAQIPLGRLSDRFGYGRFMAVSQFLACVFLGLLLWNQDFEVVFAGFLVLGLANALWMPAEQAWIAASIPPEQRGRTLAGFSAVRGLLSFPAPMIGGWLFDLYGFQVPVLLNLVLAFVDGVLILLFIREPKVA